MAPTDTALAQDTSRGAAAAQLRALRRMGNAGRLESGLRFSRSMIRRSRAAIRARNPEADETRLKLLWIEQNYGAELARAVAEQMGETAWTSKTISS